MGYGSVMPYKDRTRQIEYQREWMRRRREEFFGDKRCANCGSRKRLELDHVKSREKVSHRIWSWAPARRAAELAKCQVLCRDCHLAKSADAVEGPFRYPAKTVMEVRRLRIKEGKSVRQIGAQVGMSFQHVHTIVSGKLKYARIV